MIKPSSYSSKKEYRIKNIRILEIYENLKQMAKNKKITVQQVDIILYEENKQDYISLTDIARYKDTGHTDDIIKNWMRNRNIIELLGF